MKDYLDVLVISASRIFKTGDIKCCQIKPIPFKPGYPVDLDNFEGRSNLIEEFIKYLKQTEFGIHQHFLIKGKRGMGKSSFAQYIAYIAEKNIILLQFIFTMMVYMILKRLSN